MVPLISRNLINPAPYKLHFIMRLDTSDNRRGETINQYFGCCNSKTIFWYLPLATIGADVYCHWSLHLAVCPSVWPSVHPEWCYCSYSLRIFTPQPLRAPGYCRTPSGRVGGQAAGQTNPVNTLTSILFHGSFSNLYPVQWEHFQTNTWNTYGW